MKGQLQARDSPSPHETVTVVESPGVATGPAAERLSLGASVGRYVVLEEIGRGGMGRVLRAYDPKLQREVALKEVRSKVLGREGARRLVSEARAMAKLSHPNVVAVYDVHELEQDRVVIVMEYVAGQTLSQWLEAKPAWPEIVAHFRRAGRGLAAAHAAGLLHRDFKPANVLVAAPRVVKVTDFGLAKVVDVDTPHSDAGASSSNNTLRRRGEAMTEAGTVMGTPRYMAPEQHAGDVLTPAADQYSFCIALWEALVGEPAFVGTELVGTKLVEAKIEGPPPWPRGSVPRAVGDAVRRGLSPDPTARWPSMDELLQALDHDPARRRRVSLGAAAAVTVLGSGLVGVQSWWAARSQRCTHAAAEEHLHGAWDEARRVEVKDAILGVGAAYASDVSTHAERALDTYAAAWTQMHVETCEATTVRGEQSPEVMDLRMSCLHRAKVDLAAATSVLARADADTVQNTHEVTARLPPLLRCADVEALREDTEPPAAHEVDAVETIREHLARGGAADKAGHFDEARSEVEAARALLADVDYAPVHAEVAIAWGDVLERFGEYNQAETALRDALTLAASTRQWRLLQDVAARLMFVVGNQQQRFDEARRYVDLVRGTPDADPEHEAGLRSAIGNLMYAQGSYAEAETEQRAALALWASVPSPNLADVASSHNNLGAVLKAQRKHEEAEAEYRIALGMEQEILGPDHPSLAVSLNNVAALLRAQGKYAEAEAEDRRALAIRENALGPDHPYVAQSLNNLAGTLLYRGEYEDAEAHFRRALALREGAAAPDALEIAQSHSNLGNALYAQGKYEEAEAEQRRALAAREELLGPDRVEIATSRNNLAVVLEAQRKYAEAEAEHRRALAIKEAALGPDDPECATSRNNLGLVLWRLERYAEAEAEHRRALEIRERALGPEHPVTVATHTGLANALGAQEKYAEAEAEYRRGLELGEKVLGTDHPDVATCRNNFAEMMLERGSADADEALALAEAAWKRRSRDDIPRAHRAQTAFVLARALWAAGDRGDRGRALELAEQARSGYAAEGRPGDDEKGAAIAAWITRHRSR